MTLSLTTPESPCSEPSESRQSCSFILIGLTLMIWSLQHHCREGQGELSSSTRARRLRLVRRVSIIEAPMLRKI